MGTTPATPSLLLRWLLKAPIHLYRSTLSGLIGRQCRHLPTCSEYALGAIDRHGAWAGFCLAAHRVGRCRPWGTSGYDPVPQQLRWWGGWLPLPPKRQPDAPVPPGREPPPP
jgi:uncharacterized protein